MKNLLRLLVLAICWTWGTGAVQACSCEPISPQAGFDHAQYVFTGKVVQAEQHGWIASSILSWGSAISFSRSLRRAVATSSIIRKPVTGRDRCNRRAFPAPAMSRYGSKTGWFDNRVRENHRAMTGPESR